MKKLFLIPLLLSCSLAIAQTIESLKLDKAAAQTGQTVQATVDLKGENANCGLLMDWGDGTVERIKIVEKSQMPFIASHTYAKPGDFTVRAEGKQVTSHLKCIGKTKTALIKVAAPAATTAAATPTAAAAKPTAAGPVCPEGWKLDAKSVSKKTQSFTCTAKSGTATPEKKLACPGDLGYFENSKKDQLGCRV